MKYDDTISPEVPLHRLDVRFSPNHLLLFDAGKRRLELQARYGECFVRGHSPFSHDENYFDVTMIRHSTQVGSGSVRKLTGVAESVQLLTCSHIQCSHEATGKVQLMNILQPLEPASPGIQF